MEWILARAQKARIAAARKLALANASARQRRLTRARREQTAYEALVTEDRKTSRHEEKEDARLGPMAPRRAVGERELEAVGAMQQQRIIPPPVPHEYRIKIWNIMPKDRVVVLQGPDRHKIGFVKSVDKNSNTLLVDRMNMVSMVVPDAFLKLDPNQPRIIYREMPLPYHAVRLVYPLPDPETGVVRDTIIANLTHARYRHNRHEHTTTWDRLVAGTSTIIPWPETTEPEEVDQPGDVRILDVERKTYIPVLREPPFPVSVMDELRNKFGAFRIRHEPSYVDLMEYRAAKGREYQEKTAKRMRSPLQELHREVRLQKKARGPPVMSDGVAESIGKVMAANKPELLKKLAEKSERPEMPLAE